MNIQKKDTIVISLGKSRKKQIVNRLEHNAESELIDNIKKVEPDSQGTLKLINQYRSESMHLHILKMHNQIVKMLI